MVGDRPVIYSPEIQSNVVSLYRDHNIPAVELAKKLGISVSTIYNFINKEGARKSQRHGTSSPGVRKINDGPILRALRSRRADRVEQYFQEYLAGDTLAQIAQRNNITRQRVEQLLIKHPHYKDLRNKIRNSHRLVNFLEFKNLWERGWPVKHLAARYELSMDQIRKIVKDHPELQKPRRVYMNPEHVQEMVNFYNAGNTLQEVLTHFDYSSKSVNAIWPMMKRHPDYRPRKRGDYQR
jgi:Mor family transcriptional regulator